MKLRLLLWLFSPVVLSASDQEHFVNGTHEPVTNLNISEDLGYINPQDNTTTTMTPDFYDLDMDENYIKIFLKDQRGLMTHVTTERFFDDEFIDGNVKLPDGIGGFLLRNITCLLTTELSCTWNALNAPPDAEYSVVIEPYKMPTTICDCDKTDGRVTGCHGNIESQNQDLILHINVSCVNFWYIHSRMFYSDKIVKLNPPQNISASVVSGNLHIKWDRPILINDWCFHYQLRINKEDKPRDLFGERSHTVPNVDLSKSYFVQMRVTKTEICTVNNIWSDWSAAVGTHEPVTNLNISEDLGYINPQDDTTTTMTPDLYDLDMDENYIKIFLKDQRGLMTHVTTERFFDDEFIDGNVKLPDGIGGFLLRNITCLLTTELSCTWNALNAPPDAEYSVEIEPYKMPTTICDCDKTDGRVTGCHGNIESQNQDLILHINVSCVNFWYIHSRIFYPEKIVKLNPPQNISASVISGNLHIKWDRPILIRDRCLHYQLRINKEDKPRDLFGERSHTVPNVDLSKSYFVQMRVTKTQTCTANNIWSDWSAAVGTHEPVTKLNISEDLGYINPQDDTTTTMTPDLYDLDMDEDDTTTTMTPDLYDLDMDENYIKIFLKDQRGLMTHVTTERFFDDEFIDGNVKLPDGIGGFLLRDITCLLTTELSCTWNALNAPPDAEYSVEIEPYKMPTTICDCDKTDGRVTGCHGNIESQNQDLILHINVSCVNFWYIHSRIFYPDKIVKFNPPQNISASVISGNLHIKWDPPILIRDRCLHYQLRINKEDEPRDLFGERNHTVPNVDLSKSYFVQMRVTKTETCTVNYIWSDWSAAVEVPSSQKLLDPLVIVAIALGIPMFLLAVFLVFRCRSEMEKLFPVPSPSMKVKQLLEKDDYIQVLPAKYIEEVTEVLLVGNDECAKISE